MYSVLIEPSVPVQQSDYVLFNLPAQISLPTTALTCGTTYTDVINNVKCEVDTNMPKQIKVTFNIVS